METNTEILRNLIETKDKDVLAKFIDEHQPVDTAQAIAELDDEEIQALLAMMDDDQLALILENADDDTRTVLVRQLDNPHLLEAFEHMAKDDIVDILGDFKIGRRKEVINAMKADDRHQINTLLQYPEDSAGGIMTTDYIALKETLTVQQGLAKIRRIGPKTEVIETIFIVDEKYRLVGKCDLRNLLSSEKSTVLSEITDSHVISIAPETDQEEAARLVARYDLTAIPVVSKTRQILGIITVDDVIDVIIEEDDEDMLSMAGVSTEENINTSLFESVKLRLPWLLINLATAFLASWVVKSFESTIAQVVALSSIMTIVTGMGGNAGTQTESILVRQLADGDIPWHKCVKPLFKEIALGVIDGAINGLVTAVIVTIVYGNIWLGVIVLMAMIGNLVIAGVFGFIIPVILKKLGADPAVSSSIFLTTATDVLGFFLFLELAKIFMAKLL